MNYQPAGLFQGMSMEDIMRLYQMIQQRQQQEPMLTGPMMLAQNDGASIKTKAGIEKALPGFYGTPTPEPAAQGYGLGKATPEEILLRERQRAAAAAKLNLPPNATDEQIRKAQMEINARKSASPGTR